MQLTRRLPIFANFASPTTPAVTAGLVGCVTPIPIGLSCAEGHRPSKRERVLEQRVALLKDRLAQALRENEAIKQRMTAGGLDNSARAPLLALRSELAPNWHPPCADDIVAAFCRETTDEALAHEGAPGQEPARAVRKRGGRGRGGKAKKDAGGDENRGPSIS